MGKNTKYIKKMLNRKRYYKKEIIQKKNYIRKRQI